MILRIPDYLLATKQDCEYMPPWYYGYSHRNFISDHSVYAVIPFNWLLRWGSTLYWRWNKFRGKPPEYELVSRQQLHDMKKKAYEKGVNDGIRDIRNTEQSRPVNRLVAEQ